MTHSQHFSARRARKDKGMRTLSEVKGRARKLRVAELNAERALQCLVITMGGRMITRLPRRLDIRVTSPFCANNTIKSP